MHIYIKYKTSRLLRLAPLDEKETEIVGRDGFAERDNWTVEEGEEGGYGLCSVAKSKHTAVH